MLTGRNAIVTGGSRGIGKAIALELARNGANVAIIYSGNQTAAKETVKEINDLGRSGIAYQCDVSSYEATSNTVKEILETYKSIDILVNNAGITKDGLVLTMDEESFDRVVDTNLKGTFHMIRQVYPIMMKQRKGRIINISSVAGLMGNPGQANYASAKAGVIGLTKSVAKELAGRGVTCNAIAPGFIETDMTAVLSDRIKDAAVTQIPLNRMGRAEEVAYLAVFLASEMAGYITGEVIRIDGGLNM